MTDVLSGHGAPSQAAQREQRRLSRKLKAWHRRSVVGQLDHAALLDHVHAESGWSARFAFMIMMSAGIAILGMLLSSPAIVTGAMLISPLMAPIVGLGFALATFDWPEVRKSLLALAGGTLLAILFTGAIVLMSPLQDMTSEILSRTRPNLFDLLVAVFSALAGGYATIKGRGETIVGVALATSLMPPLAAVGYGLATMNMAVASGAFALFLTNFIAIAICVALVARFYGFGSFLTPRQTRRQAFGLVVVLVALAIPLAISLKQIAWEAWATRAIRHNVSREFGDNSRIVALDPDFARPKLVIRATVLTDRMHGKATEDLERRLSEQLRRPVQLQLSQVLVNQGTGQAELTRARVADASARSDQLARADMAARLSLVANVPVDKVLVDPVARLASAQADDGRTLLDLMQAEARLTEDSPGWSIRLLPPAGPLPAVAYPAEGLGEADGPALDAMAWALQRQGTNRARVGTRRLAGEPASRAVARTDAVADALRSRGLVIETAPPLAADSRLERELGQAASRRVQVEALTPAPPPPAPEPSAQSPVATG